MECAGSGLSESEKETLVLGSDSEAQGSRIEERRHEEKKKP